jgi:parvulin-like peptidyl-prolyl isomerase
MFGTIRKHQNWLWAIIITLTITSFVIFFSPYTRMNNAAGRRGSANFGSINGERITELDWTTAQRDVYLRYFFFIGGGRFPDEEAKKSGWDADRETYQWLLLMQRAKDMGIHVSIDDAAQAARMLTSQFERAGITSPTMFVEQVLQPHGFTMEDFERFCRNQLAFQELMYTVGLSGKLITPAEAKELYIRNHQEVSTAAVFFSASNYLASVTVTPQAISEFFSNRMANYRIPDRVQVDYVEFGVSNLLGQAEAAIKTNLTQAVDANLQRLGTNYTRFGKTPEEAKTKIREELIREEAIALAKKKASEFAMLLDTDKPKPEDLQAAAKTNGLTVKTSHPFDHQEGPTNLLVGPDFAKIAFALTPDQPFGPPLEGRDGVYIIGFNKQIPSEVPTLDQVRDKVTADYKFLQALQQAYMAGNAFHTTLTNGLNQGKTFSAISESSPYKPVTLPPFSIGTQELGRPDVEARANLNELKQAAFSTPPGKVSAFAWPDSQTLQRLPDPGGFILYVKEKLPIDQKQMEADLPKFTQMVRQKRMQEAFNLWFTKEAQKGLVDTPLLQRPQQPGTARS